MKTKLTAMLFLFVAFVAVAQVAEPAPPAEDPFNIIGALTAMVKQVINSPASLMVIIALTIISYLIEVWPKTPSWFIPYVCIIGGGFCYFLFSSRASVPHDFPHPVAVLFVNGMICGIASLVIHQQVIKRWLIKKPAGTTPPPDPSGV